MNYADIKYCDVANGEGVRVSLFVSGCTHHCKECFNKEAWDFHYGNPFTQKEIDRILEYLKPNYIAGLSLLGGEPMEPVNQEGILPLLRVVKQTYPEKNIWCYTGYPFDRLLDNPKQAELLKYIDVLVDGKFKQALRDESLLFRGSSNQRLIDVKASLKANKTVLLELNYDL